MAAGDARQVGVKYLIGIGNAYYEGHMPQSANVGTNDEITDHKDKRGATDSHLVMNPGKTLSLTLDIIGEAVADFVGPAKGDVISLKAPYETVASKWFVRDASVSASSGYAQLSLSLDKPDSMAAVYGATLPLDAVTTLAASAGDKQVELTWVKASDATGYRIYVNTADQRPGAHTAEILNGDAEAFVVSGLGNGTKYFFWVETLGGLVPNPVTASVNATPTD